MRRSGSGAKDGVRAADTMETLHERIDGEADLLVEGVRHSSLRFKQGAVFRVERDLTAQDLTLYSKPPTHS